MRYNPAYHHRRSIRLKGHDYRQPGLYFITICTHQRQCILGDIVDGEMRLSQLGLCVQFRWQNLAQRFRVGLDAFVVMPNHIHGIIRLDDGHQNIVIGDDGYQNIVIGDDDYSRRGEAFGQNIPELNQRLSPNASPLRTPAGNQHSPPNNMRPRGTQSGSIGAIIQNFKSVSTRRINQLRHTPGTPVWQRNYYEHIIRDQTALQNIRRYILNNPKAWESDRLYGQ